MKRNYFIKVGDSLSQLLNTVILNGDSDESVSGRSFKNGVLLGKKNWYYVMKSIDFLFFLIEKDHCKKAFFSDLYRLERRLQEDTAILLSLKINK